MRGCAAKKRGLRHGGLRGVRPVIRVFSHHPDGSRFHANSLISSRTYVPLLSVGSIGTGQCVSAWSRVHAPPGTFRHRSVSAWTADARPRLGGTQQRGSVSAFVAIEDERVSELLTLLRGEFPEVLESVPVSTLPLAEEWGQPTEVIDVRVGGAVVFVIDLAQVLRV